MPHVCSQGCGCISDTPEERARHERCCPERTLSCCQGSAACSLKIRDWVNEEQALACRHGSHGLFGAIREDNVELVQLFLLQRKPNLASLFTHETAFGETILTYAASLGRSEIVRVLLKTIHTIVQNGSDTFALSDLLDHETSRGKSAIVEAAKSNRQEVVAVLLAHHANAQLPSRIHHKSALDWAVALGHDTIVEMIDEHVKLEEHARALFKAVAKFDVPAVKSLTDGGAPFQQGQDAVFQHQLESKRRALYLAEQNLDQASHALQEVDQSKEVTRSEIQAREKNILCLHRKREGVESRRRNEVREVTAQVHQALTSTEASQIQEVDSPPLEYELISKALCTLLHIRVKSDQSDGAEGRLIMPHWTEIKRLLQDSSRFFHRVRHYHFETDVVELAAEVEIEGLPGRCSDHLSTIVKRDTEGQTSGSPLIVAQARWLQTIFEHVETHKLEHSLLMKASEERDILERSKIDFQVLTSRAALLKRERDETNASIKACTDQISQLERKIEISRVMRFAAGGHSILSWAASAGNEETVKLLLKRGAHTAIGEDCLGWCATIIQLAFRRHLQRQELTEISLGANEKRKKLIVSLRTKSLSNLIRERLRSLHLPLAEALFNGHSNIVAALSSADIPPFQALNLFPMFRRPQGMLPRPQTDGDAVSNAPSINGSELLSHLVEAGELYSLKPVLDCAHADSLRRATELFYDFLHQRRQKVEEKIAKRKETLHHRFRRAKIAELASAIQRGDFVGMIQASDEGGISLDYEDPTTALTPLIRAAQEDIQSQVHEWCKNPVGENCTAVAYLLDRISPHRPTIDYENANGHTALSLACMLGRLEVVRDLIDRGANVERESNLLHCTAYDLAVDAKQLDVMEFLDQRRS
ncbi:hypothetical protein ACHAXT_006247 [Thalassiosira profunda]